LYQPRMMDDNECGTVGWMSGRGNQSTRRTPAAVQLCLSQIPHDYTRARTLAVGVGSQRLTTWATAWLFYSLNLHSSLLQCNACWSKNW
jgi:hypothetical protein